MKDTFTHLGFPDYFRLELGVAKILGVLALLISMVPAKLKEFAYAGFTITFTLAFIAHLSSGKPVPVAIAPVIFLGILIVSYSYYKKIEA